MKYTELDKVLDQIERAKLDWDRIECWDRESQVLLDVRRK